ncbi:MAG: hypothetical protein JO271_08150 [Verrucomicrobia bacterium]|nr:hypothetical protein [Verrucomicrobiota bacterium]
MALKELRKASIPASCQTLWIAYLTNIFQLGGYYAVAWLNGKQVFSAFLKLAIGLKQLEDKFAFALDASGAWMITR